MKKILFYCSTAVMVSVLACGNILAEDTAAQPKYTAVTEDGKTVTIKYTPIIDPVTFTAPAPVGEEKMKRAILLGCPVREWQATVSGDNAITATLNVRKHKVTVLITYNANSFTITYKDSFNLVGGDNELHRNYKRWVDFLRGDIIKNLM